MEPQEGGWLWLLIDFGFVAALGSALIYGTLMWHSRRKDRVTQAKRDKATRDNFRAD